MRSFKRFALSGIALAFLGMSVSAQAQETEKVKVTVKIARKAQKRFKELKALSKYDILGVNLKKGQADLYVSQEDVENIRNAGFSIVSTDDLTRDEDVVEEYLTPDQVIDELKRVHAAHPQITRLKEYGKTHRGRPVLAIEITSDFEDKSRPVILFNAMHHARELMTTEVAIHMIKTLTTKAARNDEIGEWLNKYRIVVVPQVNPDGNDLVHNGQRMWRKNAWQDGSRVMGVDLNRNYPALWNYCNGSSGSTSSETYRGKAPGSEPETQAMMKLIKDVRPVASISYHSYSELVLYPFGCDNVNNPSLELFKKVGGAIRDGIQDDNGKPGTYALGTPPELLYNADGGDIDWHWSQNTVLSFVIEVNSSFQGFQPNYKRWRDVTVRRQEGGWMNLIRRMGQSAVRGRVAGDINFSKLTYTISMRGARGNMHRWEGPGDVAPFQVRNDGGLIYNLLDKGEYVFTFGYNNSQVKTLPVTVGEGVTDLGEIQF